MPEDYKLLVQQSVLSGPRFRRATFTGQLPRQNMPWVKATIRPVIVKDQRVLQISLYDTQQCTVKNYDERDAGSELAILLGCPFKNIYVETSDGSLQVRVTKRGKVLDHRSSGHNDVDVADLLHDRQKKQVLPANKPDVYLREVGIMSADGRVRADKQRKFRQINEFLKLLSEVVTSLKLRSSPLLVLDFGCGNAYLTFATYHYFNHVAGLAADVIGVDSDAKAIGSHRSKLVNLGWPDLSFQVDQIRDYVPSRAPDVVLALHACDTATDDALA
jgi:hypothetical protein